MNFKILSNIFINDLEEVTKHSLLKFAGDIKLGVTANMLEDRAAVQKDLSRLRHGTPWHSARTKAQSCPEEERALGRGPVRQQLCGKGLWVSSNSEWSRSSCVPLAATCDSSSWAVRTGDQPGDPRRGLSPLISPHKTYILSRKNGCKLKQERFRLGHKQ